MAVLDFSPLPCAFPAPMPSAGLVQNKDEASLREGYTCRNSYF
jgi:hypothetical protein